MGIKNLMKLIYEHAPDSVTETSLKNLFGRKICIDASMTLYQYLIAVRTDEANNYTLLSETGEPTSTIKMMENGVKPIYVFDGTPPKLKGAELLKRSKLREEAELAINEAKESGDVESLSKLNKRNVYVTKKHNNEARYLLELMGVPVVQAPSEAEAQCAELVKSDICYACGSEDMDSLTLGVPILLRRLTFSKLKNLPVLEVSLKKVLEGLKMDMDNFVDLCILLGCDYCDSIRGIGAKRAVQLIQKHRTIEKVLENLDLKKYKVPENFPFEDARQLFKNPKVLNTKSIEIKWNLPNSQGLLEFLVNQKGFSIDRVKKGIEKIEKSRRDCIQGRITSFFSSKNVVQMNNISSDEGLNHQTSSNENSKTESSSKVELKISKKRSSVSDDQTQEISHSESIHKLSHELDFKLEPSNHNSDGSELKFINLFSKKKKLT